MPSQTTRPNFLIIVADDLGYSDLSCYASEIRTPNIDSLASTPTSLRFTDFHVAAACSPTRAMLMTGTDHHLTGLGQLAEVVRNSTAHQGKPGHEGYLNDRVVAVPELLRDGGYHTLMAGKWHLGLKPEYSPQARGFDKSFAMLAGCCNHYAFEPEYEHDNDVPRFFDTAVTALHMEGREYVSKSTLPKDFYSSDFYADKLVHYLEERNDEEKEKPFFAYLPFTAPHWPLQAPKEEIDKYTGMYDDGPEALRLKRLQALKAMHLIPPNTTPHPIVSVTREQQEWSALSADERTRSARSMEIYAGMVTRMDTAIGRVLSHLKSTGEYDNTYIFFMSDNGAEGASYEARDLIRENILTHIGKYYDNSLENLGRYNSFIWYGNRWAQAATAPGRLYKMFSTEGGCRVPLVVKPGKGLKEHISNETGDGGESKGKITNAFCTVQDIAPTLLDLAGITHPSVYKNRPVLPLRGKSWLPFLQQHSSLTSNPSNPSTPNDTSTNDTFNSTSSPQSETFIIHSEKEATGFECAGSAALRRGRFKITYVPHPHGPQKWEMYDILSDPGETTDISLQYPGEFEEMLERWEEYKDEVGVVGVRGELAGLGEENAFRDEFEDTGRWIRWIGKGGAPEGVPKFW